ncbi:MAG: hypothetical protein ACI9HJ_001379 [Ulvibacter sp.]|jgi:hypothetical protein
MSTSLLWYFRRHSLLFKIRFKMVSRKSSLDRIENFCYNTINPKYDIPPIYFQLNRMILGQPKSDLSDLEKAKKIAKWLRNHIKGGPGLGKSSNKALRKMIRGEGGVCSDMSQVYNNFCVINNLKVKEWGLKIVSQNRMIRGGHSFNEVYSREFKKWVLLDVSKSIFFYHTNSKIPLSVFELIQLKKENKEIHYFEFNKKVVVDKQYIEDIYLTPNSFPFLITNYSNKTYDYFLDKLGFLPESIIHGLIYLSGKSYAFEFPRKEYKMEYPITKPVLAKAHHRYPVNAK